MREGYPLFHQEIAFLSQADSKRPIFSDRACAHAVAPKELFKHRSS